MSAAPANASITITIAGTRTSPATAIAVPHTVTHQQHGATLMHDAQRPSAHDRRDERAARDRRQQEPVQHRSATEPFGERGEQRARHAEHHREQVDPERAHDHRMAAEEPQALEHRRCRRAAAARRPEEPARCPANTTSATTKVRDIDAVRAREPDDPDQHARRARARPSSRTTRTSPATRSPRVAARSSSSIGSSDRSTGKLTASDAARRSHPARRAARAAADRATRSRASATEQPSDVAVEPSSSRRLSMLSANAPPTSEKSRSGTELHEAEHARPRATSRSGGTPGTGARPS